MKLSNIRKQQSETLKNYLQRVENVTDSINMLQIDRKYKEIRERNVQKLQELKKRLEQRVSRLDQDHINIAVIGLEKQGKTSVINAWIKLALLPTAVERCTWAATTIVNHPAKYEAVIDFYSEQEFKQLTDDLKNDFGEDKSKKISFPLSDGKIYDELERMNPNSAKELKLLSDAWPDIKRYINHQSEIVFASDPKGLMEKLFKYISRIDQKSGKEQNIAYAVKHARVYIPFEEQSADFQISDLPGLNAPGNRAEQLTWKVVEKNSDVILWIKNAHANPSLVRDEEHVWTKASQSDESIRLTERLFVLLNQADEDKIEHGRNCHLQAKKIFMDRGIPEDRIFFCSARAEIKEQNLETTFDWAEDDVIRAKQNVSRYMRSPEATTGFPEFRKSIRDFVMNTLPRLEKASFEYLKNECEGSFRQLTEFINEISENMNLAANAAPEEVARFEQLWSPPGALETGMKGLATELNNALAETAKNQSSNTKSLEEFKNRIISGLDKLKADIIEQITPEKFKKELSLGSTSSLVISEKEGIFRSRQRRLLKEKFPKISEDFCRYTMKAVEDLWKTVRETADHVMPQSKFSNIKSMPENFLGKDGFVSNMQSIVSEDNIQHGYEALLKVAAYSPVEYLLIDDPDWLAERIRILEKIGRLREIYQKRETGSVLAMIEKKIAEKQKSSKIVSMLSKQIRENDSEESLLQNIQHMIRDHIESISEVLLYLIAPEAGRKKKDTHTVSSHAIDNNRIERVVQNVRESVSEVIDSVKVILLDNDFGLMGYHLSIIENIRLALDESVRNGEIRELAFKHRREIWREEKVFALTELYQQQYQAIDNLKRNLSLSSNSV